MSNLNSIEALEIQLQNHQPESKEYIDIIHQLVVLYLNIDLDKANYWIDEAEKLASQINYHESIGLCLHFRGVSHYQLSDYEIALDYFLKADEILSKSDSWRNRIKAKANIGLIYHQTHQYQEALRVFFDIENEIISYPEDLTHAQLYVNIDNSYCSLNDPINGSKYTKKALSIATQLDNKYGLAICHGNLAGHYF